MGTTAEKLTYLNTTKQNLKTVINTTGAGLTDESTFRSYANVLNDKILGAINGDVDLFEEYPKVSGNGIDLSLNGVVEGKMSITPQGVSSQNGEPAPTTPISVKNVTGENSLVLQNENLLDKTTLLPKSTINGTTGEIEDYDGCGASEQYISVLPNTQYTFSCSTTMLALRVSCYNLEKEHIERKSSTSNVKSFSFLTPDDCHYVRCSFNYNNVIIVTQEVLNTLNLQVTKGSIAPSTYVEHEEQNYQLPLGNIELNSTPDGTIRDEIIGSSAVSYNLFDGARKNVYFNNQKQFASGVADALTTNYIPASEGDIFTISTELASGGIVIASFDKNKVCISRSAVGTSSLSLTYTCPANTKYIIGSNFIGMTTNTTLVEGSEAKPYFPYGQVGMWYKREYIGKVVLDGSENWTVESGGAPYTLNISNSLITISNDELPNVLVDMFKRVTYNSNWNNYNSLVAPGTTLRPTILKFRYTDISSLDDWKVWLSENNVTVYYLKAQYTDIPITNTTLINQLNNIYNNAHSYNGTTNITTTYASGNEQMYLDIEALKNVWEVAE